MLRVLIVDDAAFFRKMLRRVLDDAGYVVVGEAKNGHDAVLQYRTLWPEVVLLDIAMPIMDGLSALKAIREIDEFAAVIMISALGEHMVLQEAIRRGARDFLGKPLDRDKLIRILASL
ncbi:MAG: response regulator [Negativicutes bacterium]|nr:response regulator [Negativicutes bacterium]